MDSKTAIKYIAAVPSKYDKSGGTISGQVTVGKVGNASTINFPATVNDPGFIQHIEDNNVSKLRFVVSDDKSTDDLFEWGSSSNGQFSRCAYMNTYGDFYVHSDRLVWHSGNFDPNSKANSSHTHNYLPLSGGHLSGKLTAESNNDQINAKRGNNIAVMSTSNADGEYLFGGRSSTFNADFIEKYIRIGTNKLQYSYGSKTYDIYHTGNKPTPDSIGAATHNHNHSSIIGGTANKVQVDQPNDFAGLAKKNNVNIDTWYGFSISNKCASTIPADGVAFSVNARNGQVFAKGDFFAYNGERRVYNTGDGNINSEPNRLVLRDGNADISARLLKTTYQNDSYMSGAIAFRANNTSDNYTRYCSNPGAVRDWLNVPDKGHYHNFITSKGNMNPQTGRTQNHGDIYSYNTAGGNSGGPVTYTSVMGFGRGNAGTVEIAGEWTSGRGLWVRALRDTTDDWYPWTRIYTEAYKPSPDSIGAVPKNSGSAIKIQADSNYSSDENSITIAAGKNELIIQSSMGQKLDDTIHFNGKKVMIEPDRTPLWKGCTYLNKGHNFNMRKPLSQCQNGWILVFSDYDPGGNPNGNNYNWTTHLIPKNSALVNSGNTLFIIPNSESGGFTIKAAYIKDNRIEGQSVETVDGWNDVVLREVLEY